jgi:hypothetical protein
MCQLLTATWILEINILLPADTVAVFDLIRTRYLRVNQLAETRSSIKILYAVCVRYTRCAAHIY